MKTYYQYMVSFGLMLPSATFAVTLGDMDVESYLNQPLKASIRLSGLGDMPLSGLKVKLASPEAFKRVGIERPYTLSRIQFTLKNVNGTPYILISSTDRIEAPYLQLLLDVTWAKGQYYRNYTLFLDPPNYAFGVKSKSKQTVYRVKAAPIELPYPKKAADLVDKSIVKKSNTETYGPVKSHEDLWDIARHYRKEGVSLQQLMLGIMAYNPHAFIHGNINGLKKGVTLTIPPVSEIKQIPADKAKLEVLAQAEAWTAKKPINHVMTPPYLDKAKQASIKPKPSFLPPLSIDKLSGKVVEAPKETSTLQSETSEVNEAQPKKTAIVKTKVMLSAKKDAIFDDDLIQVPSLLTNMVKSNDELGFDNKKSNDEVSDEPEIAVDKKQEVTKTKAIEESAKEKRDSLANKEIAVAISAIASVKESNELLRSQVKALTKQNQLLRVQSQATEKELSQLKQQLKELSSLMAKAQNGPEHEMEDDNGLYNVALTLFGLILFAVAGGAVLLYLNQSGVIEIAFLNRFLEKEESEDEVEDENDDDSFIEQENTLKASSHEVKRDERFGLPQDSNTEATEASASSEPEDAAVETSLENDSVPSQDNLVENIEPQDDDISLESDEIDTSTESSEEAFSLDFEEGLSPPLNELKEKAPDLPIEDSESEKEAPELAADDAELSLSLSEESDDTANQDSQQQTDEASDKVVSTATQLALAETYISMGDTESAKEALNEVLSHGDDDAKAKAKKLLDGL